MKLTVIIPTYNEEKFLQDAINSVSWADEIIVIDSYSQDKTIKIAEKNNCVILQREFDNFSSQKNFALKYATHDWVLFLDADERITEKLKYEIIKAINQTEYVSYELVFSHFFMNRFLRFGSQGNDKVVRLINKNFCKYSDKLVHEKIESNGKVGLLTPPVPHYTYNSIVHYLKKRDKYADFQAQELYDRGVKPNAFNMAIKPIYRFIYEYYFRLGFLDGIPGLICISINAYGVFSRYVKLYLLRQSYS